MISLLALGIILIIVGFMLAILPEQPRTPHADKTPEPGPENGQEPEEACGQKSVRGAGVIMIGPIPVVFGSDPAAAVAMMLIALAIMLVWAVSIKSI